MLMVCQSTCTRTGWAMGKYSKWFIRVSLAVTEVLTACIPANISDSLKVWQSSVISRSLVRKILLWISLRTFLFMLLPQNIWLAMKAVQEEAGEHAYSLYVAKDKLLLVLIMFIHTGARTRIIVCTHISLYRPSRACVLARSGLCERYSTHKRHCALPSCCWPRVPSARVAKKEHRGLTMELGT